LESNDALAAGGRALRSPELEPARPCGRRGAIAEFLRAAARLAARLR